MKHREIPSKLDKEVNALGLKCPEPVMLLHAALNSVDKGSYIKIIGDDMLSIADIHKLCKFLKHKLIAEEQDELKYSIVIQKKPKEE